MKQLISKFTFLAALLFMIAGTSQAQLFSKKMPVGVKTYSYFDQESLFENEFKDMKGSLDKYNFYNLDTSLKQQMLTLVYDRKASYWRLPLSLNEAMGIAEKEGEEPLQRRQVAMGDVSPAIRQKIE